MLFKYTTSYLVMICYFNYAWLLGYGYGLLGYGLLGYGLLGYGYGLAGAIIRHAVWRSVIQQSSRQPPTPHNTTWQIKDLKTFLHYRLTS